METREILLALTCAAWVGEKTISQVMNDLNPQNLMKMSADEIYHSSGVGRKKSQRVLQAIQRDAVDQLLGRLEKLGIGWVARGDDLYPERLEETPWPPWVLFYRGDVSLLQQPCVAMVGTRAPTVYGRRTAEYLAEELASNGVTVVSGLARGIDTHAHRGALKGEGKTIAVLATPLTEVYPPENRILFNQIADEGLVISETPPGTHGRAGMFPIRNRIIAGVSRGTVVVEASMNSGTRYTVDYTLDLAREVFAVPGPMLSPKSQYPLSLIQAGSKLIMDTRDILEELSCMPFTFGSAATKEPIELSQDEQKIVEILSDKAMTVDELFHFSKFSFGHLHSVLLSLSMKHFIEPLPGSVYQLRV